MLKYNGRYIFFKFFRQCPKLSGKEDGGRQNLDLLAACKCVAGAVGVMGRRLTVPTPSTGHAVLGEQTLIDLT